MKPLYVVFFFFCFFLKTSLHWLRLFRRMLSLCLAVKPQKFFCGLWNFKTTTEFFSFLGELFFYARVHFTASDVHISFVTAWTCHFISQKLHGVPPNPEFLVCSSPSSLWFVGYERVTLSHGFICFKSTPSQQDSPLRFPYFSPNNNSR